MTTSSSTELYLQTQQQVWDRMTKAGHTTHSWKFHSSSSSQEFPDTQLLKYRLQTKQCGSHSSDARVGQDRLSPGELSNTVFMEMSNVHVK